MHAHHRVPHDHVADAHQPGGLESLTTVGGYVSIAGNTALADISALANLASIGDTKLPMSGSLEIGPGNAMLADISFPALATLTGSLSIDGESGRVSSLAFPALTSIGGGLGFGLTALTNLDGLAGVTSVGGTMNIQDNAALTDTGGLSALATVANGLLVVANDGLTRLSLPALTSVATNPAPSAGGASTGLLIVSANPALTAIDLPALTFVAPGGVRIGDNASLPQCQADAVAAKVGQTCDCTGNTGTAACN
jgi:hypothetical protein